jgi:hypothetical protein
LNPFELRHLFDDEFSEPSSAIRPIENIAMIWLKAVVDGDKL